MSRTIPGLVSRFAASNAKALIDIPDADACTVRLRQEMLCNNGGYACTWFGHFKL